MERAEAILSAIGAGIPIYESNKGHVVVDIGGGTTDVAVISLGSIVHSISVKSAGDKLDLAIIEYMKKKYGLAIGERTAEEIKKTIASAVILKDELEMGVKGRDYQEGLPKSIQVNDDLFKGVIKGMYVMEQGFNQAITDLLTKLEEIKWLWSTESATNVKKLEATGFWSTLECVYSVALKSF